MEYGFTCLGCGRPLTQSTVLFDLLDPVKKPGTERLVLYVTQKELRHLWRWDRRKKRYTLTLQWKEFLRHLSNQDRKSCPELWELKYQEVEAYVRKERTKYPEQTFIKLGHSLNMDEHVLRHELRRVVEIFKDGDGKYCREIEAAEPKQLLKKLVLYSAKTGEKTAESPRCCGECGEPVFDGAGTLRHICVVLLDTKENLSGADRILNDLYQYLCTYRGEECGSWYAKPHLEQKRKKKSIHSVTVEFEREHIFLTMAAVRNSCCESGRDVFPDAAAYVLCGCPRIEEGRPGADAKPEEKAMLDCLRGLQKCQSKRLERVYRKTGCAPVLVLYDTEENPDDFPEMSIANDAIKPIFSQDHQKASNSPECAGFCRELNKWLNAPCYHTQMFYSREYASVCAGKAAHWILQVTGCIPIQLQRMYPDDSEKSAWWKQPEYTVAAPICKSLLPNEQQSLRQGKKRSPFGAHFWREEVAARIYLFDNTEVDKQYLNHNENQLKKVFSAAKADAIKGKRGSHK